MDDNVLCELEMTPQSKNLRSNSNTDMNDATTAEKNLGTQVILDEEALYASEKVKPLGAVDTSNMKSEKFL